MTLQINQRLNGVKPTNWSTSDKQNMKSAVDCISYFSGHIGSYFYIYQFATNNDPGVEK
jgi:hypothetical protein